MSSRVDELLAQLGADDDGSANLPAPLHARLERLRELQRLRAENARLGLDPSELARQLMMTKTIAKTTVFVCRRPTIRSRAPRPCARRRTRVRAGARGQPREPEPPEPPLAARRRR